MVDKKKILGITAGVAAGAAAVGAVVAARRRRNGGPPIYHVQATDEGWVVQAEGERSPNGSYKTKKEAVSAGRSLAGDTAPSQLVIHRVDGTVQEEYGYDAEGD